MLVRLVRVRAELLDASWIGREMIVGHACGTLSDLETDRRGHATAVYIGGTRIPITHETIAVYDTLGAE